MSDEVKYTQEDLAALERLTRSREWALVERALKDRHEQLRDWLEVRGKGKKRLQGEVKGIKEALAKPQALLEEAKQQLGVE